jgi:hypothetical protein
MMTSTLGRRAWIFSSMSFSDSATLAIGGAGLRAEKGKLAGRVRRLELLQHEPAKQLGEHADGQEEAGSASDPATAIEADAAAGRDHMHMRVMRHRRAPGVQHRGDSDARAQMLGVGGDPEQRLGRGLEQQVIDHPLVLPGDGGDRRRQGEHNMEIGNGQELGLAIASHSRSSSDECKLAPALANDGRLCILSNIAAT